HERRGADVGAAAGPVGSHGGAAEDLAVLLEHDGLPGWTHGPERLCPLGRQVERVGVGLAGLDDLVEEWPHLRPVVLGHRADAHPSPLTTPVVMTIACPCQARR